MTDHLRSLVRHLLSIKFGVILMLSLMLAMMFATQFEASFGTAAMKRYIYGSVGFDVGVFLFVVNIVWNTWKRRPFKFRHTGFLTVHCGVLIIVAGGLMTRWFGIDGTMPIAEGDASRAIELPDNDLVVTAGDRTVRHPTEYELLPTANDHDDLYDVPGTPYLLHVTRFYGSGAVQDTLMDDSDEENPVLRVAFSAGGAQPAGGWLVARQPARRTLASGTARISFVEPGDFDAVRARWEGDEAAAASASEDPHGPGAGHLRLVWSDGESEVLHVPGPGVAIPTSRPGIDVEAQEIFRSFILTADGHADAPEGPENPAIRFHVHGPDGVEDHFSFTAFPDFRIAPEEGEMRMVSHGEWQPDPTWLGRSTGMTEVAIVREAPGRYVTYSSWGSPTDGAPLAVEETRSYPERSVLIRILDAADHGRITRAVAKVSDELVRPVVRVGLVERTDGQPMQTASFVNMLRGRPEVRPASVEPAEAWIFHGEDYEFSTPEGPVKVAYAGRAIPLDFSIHLEDFREETYPGISLAASYESHVVVQPDDGQEFRTEIYMNHPLIYSGYTFYQASFQRTPGGQEITVLSVARDPGMTVSFFGFCVLVLGLILIFFVKPWFRKLDDRIARSRTQAQGA